jgi:thiol-disulfide isomerase/thioredoxin
VKNNLSSPKKILTLSLVLLLANLVTTSELTAKHKHGQTDSSKSINNGKIQAINSTAKLEEIKAQAQADHKVVVIKFFSPGCSHCTKVAPAYNKAAADSNYDYVIFTEVNAPANRDVAQKYSIAAYPTFVILGYNGVDVKRVRGANMPAVEAALTELK